MIKIVRSLLQSAKEQGVSVFSLPVHTQEQPEYKQEYLIKCDKPLSAKIFAIDDGEYAAMLFAEEY